MVVVGEPEDPPEEAPEDEERPEEPPAEQLIRTEDVKVSNPMDELDDDGEETVVKAKSKGKEKEKEKGGGGCTIL